MSDAEFVKRMAVLAQLCRFELTGQVLEAYDRLLSVHGYSKLCKALDQILATRSGRDPFPSIADVDAAVYGKNSENDTCALVAASVYAAVADFGWPNAERARAHLGEDVWSVVKAAGGWSQVCRDANEVDVGIFRAQLREIARAVMHRKAAGTDGEKITFQKQIGQPESQKQIGSVLNLLQQKMTNASEVEQ